MQKYAIGQKKCTGNYSSSSMKKRSFACRFQLNINRVNHPLTILLSAKNILYQLTKEGHLVVPVNKKVIERRQESKNRRLNILIEDMYMFFIPKNSVFFPSKFYPLIFLFSLLTFKKCVYGPSLWTKSISFLYLHLLELRMNKIQIEYW